MLLLALLTGVLAFPLGLAKAPTYSDSIFSPSIAQKYARIGSKYRSGQFPSLTDAKGTYLPFILRESCSSSTITGKWVFTVADWWTSGFFPSNFYLLHERKKLCPNDQSLASVDWLALGRRWSDSVSPLQITNSRGHDQGFLSYPFIHELRVNPTNASAITTVNRFARRLADRFNATVGCTRSWSGARAGVTDPNGPDFLVIIDNMMNLEVLLKSAELTGNKTLTNMAISHSNKTMVNHLRPDGSSYHLLDYNANTGKVIWKHTYQGYADYSTWARGQGWGIHGFATVYNYTKQPQFLATSQKMADLFLSRMPASGITPWDFDAPSARTLADTSAATTVAQGLFVLSDGLQYAGNSTGANYYRQKAVKLMIDTFKFALKPTWDSILSNGTSNNPQGSNNTGIVYGDYFGLKAGNSMLKLGLASC